MRTVSFNKFDGGITNDPRDPREDVARCVTNFDVLTNAYKMTPYRNSVSGDSVAATSQKQNFCIGYWLPGSTNVYRIFSLGVKSGFTSAEVLMKDLTTLSDNTWTSPANNQSGIGTTNFNLFVHYQKTGLIYGAMANKIWAFDAKTAGAWNDDIITTNGGTPPAFTNIAQGLVHSKDNSLYIAYDNKVMVNFNGTWTIPVLTLPDSLYITSLCEYGNYLAIAAAPLANVGSSVVYLWDRDSTLANIPEKIDWGEGTLKILEEIRGRLVGISLAGNNLTRFKDRVYFKSYSGGGGAVPFQILENTQQGTPFTQLTIQKQKIDGRLYFMMSIYLSGVLREGVWSCGSNLAGSQFSIVHERTPNNDTTTTSGLMKGFFVAGDYLFQSYVDNGSYALSKTNDQNVYLNQTAIYESTINPEQPERRRGSAGSRSIRKQLIAAAVAVDPLLSGQQVVLKYRVDSNDPANWQTILTETTVGKVVTERTFDAAGGQFQNGREYEFRVESTGGAVITEIKYKYEELESLL